MLGDKSDISVSKIYDEFEAVRGLLTKTTNIRVFDNCKIYRKLFKTWYEDIGFRSWPWSI